MFSVCANGYATGTFTDSDLDVFVTYGFITTDQAQQIKDTDGACGELQDLSTQD